MRTCVRHWLVVGAVRDAAGHWFRGTGRRRCGGDFRILPRRKGGGPRWATGVLYVPRAGELTQHVIGLAIDMHRDAWRALFERPCSMYKLHVMNGGTQAYRAGCFRRPAIDKALEWWWLFGRRDVPASGATRGGIGDDFDLTG